MELSWHTKDRTGELSITQVGRVDLRSPARSVVYRMRAVVRRVLMFARGVLFSAREVLSAVC